MSYIFKLRLQSIVWMVLYDIVNSEKIPSIFLICLHRQVIKKKKLKSIIQKFNEDDVSGKSYFWNAYICKQMARK